MTYIVFSGTLSLTQSIIAMLGIMPGGEVQAAVIRFLSIITCWLSATKLGSALAPRSSAKPLVIIILIIILGNNTHDNVYDAVIMTMSSLEFTRFIW